MKRSLLFILIAVTLVTSCNNDKNTENEPISTVPAPAVMNYSVLKIYPHDTTSYTEGLFLLNNSCMKAPVKQRKQDL